MVSHEFVGSRHRAVITWLNNNIRWQRFTPFENVLIFTQISIVSFLNALHSFKQNPCYSSTAAIPSTLKCHPCITFTSDPPPAYSPCAQVPPGGPSAPSLLVLVHVPMLTAWQLASRIKKCVSPRVSSLAEDQCQRVLGRLCDRSVCVLARDGAREEQTAGSGTRLGLTVV